MNCVSFSVALYLKWVSQLINHVVWLGDKCYVHQGDNIGITKIFFLVSLLFYAYTYAYNRRQGTKVPKKNLILPDKGRSSIWTFTITFI